MGDIRWRAVGGSGVLLEVGTSAAAPPGLVDVVVGAETGGSAPVDGRTVEFRLSMTAPILPM